MTFTPDSGGVFASDAHRRVQAALPNPDDEALSIEFFMIERIAKDDHLGVTTEEVVEILKDLEADGHAEQVDNGWKNTEAGFDALTGPNGNEPPSPNGSKS